MAGGRWHWQYLLDLLTDHSARCTRCSSPSPRIRLPASSRSRYGLVPQPHTPVMSQPPRTAPAHPYPSLSFSASSSHRPDSQHLPPTHQWIPQSPSAFSHDQPPDPLSSEDAWSAANVTPTSRPLRSASHIHVPSPPRGTHTNLAHPPMPRQPATMLFGPEHPANPSSAHPLPRHEPTPPSAGSNPLTTNLARDAMMAYAYFLYDSPGPGSTPLGLTSVPIFYATPESDTTDYTYRNRLLPLLLTLVEYHPQHLPILLLLACTYHALGDFDASLSISHRILSLNPQYVEAMSNIGTTMKALNQTEKAYEWWWKALQLRPTYWDALDNILGMTFTLAHNAADHGRRLVYYRQAQGVCQYVQKHVFNSDGRLSQHLQPNEIPRLQRAVFTNGTIYATLGPTNVDRAILEHARALELVFRPPPPTPEAEQYVLRDILLATCAAGHIMCSESTPNLPGLSSIGIFQPDVSSRLGDPSLNFLYLVRTSGDQLFHALLQAGGGVLPTPLLLPEQVTQLRALLFPQTKGVLPAICTRTASGELKPPPDSVRQQTNGMTNTVLLTLAKRFQDNTLGNATLPGTNGLRISTSVVILLYYLALTLSPAPSTFNNLGIVLSGISESRSGQDGQLLDGTALARMFYTAGLHLDGKHPHLLTNLGSLLKDQGQSDQAIKLYTKAVEQKPDFDIALANLGNAIKDVGRPWDAIGYYKRAAAANPNLPEAICGLVNSLCSVCDWRGRGTLPNEVGADDAGYFVPPGLQMYPGWMTRMVAVTEEQVKQNYYQDLDGILPAIAEECTRALACARGRPLTLEEVAVWQIRFQSLHGTAEDRAERRVNGPGFLLRFIDWIQPQLQRRWYIQTYGKTLSVDQPVPLPDETQSSLFMRPTLPKMLLPPAVPSVLPFHTFTYPLSPRLTRLIPHRSALRISYAAYSHPWLPKHVQPPPKPPLDGKINIGYVSNDVNNHPLSHLMQNVFGMHDRRKFNVFLYTTSPWDGTAYRPRIAGLVENFLDVSGWSLEAIVGHIKEQGIHILVNLGGYTKGARNDVFAVRPCPVQMQLMGYAGTLGAGWCDYLVCDPIACPQETSAVEQWRNLRARRQHAASAGGSIPEDSLDINADIDPEDSSNEWTYTEKFLYMPHTFMVTDHKQSFRGDDNLSPEERAAVPVETLWLEEERRRLEARAQVFPDLPPYVLQPRVAGKDLAVHRLRRDVIIFANFNQLYKIDPGIFLVWLRILRKVPRSILWLLRFPAAGEEHLMRSAKLWAGEEVASRIRFTDVAKKDWHIFRARVADLFLDTAECNAHTIAADVLWAGTPILTWPKHAHKMCSRVAASMVNATGFGERMTVHSAEDYEARAIALAESVHYVPHHEPDGTVLPRGQGELVDLRRNMYVNRDHMPLFDTLRWTRNMEKGYQEAWRRWVEGTQFETSDEWEACDGDEKRSGCIWVQDDDPVHITHT
ncbi:TPR-like protein [Lentinus tigrinus ALCF2SS1-7]|uniref:TPR-like protein n=1 Tax=Lentinus tigrinus ALCF2SS1-7 TaxID=1328758 RepID=UPI0011661F5C|nr:TPR-like protein [Lentinus tigrinus ALCF2SS1-7]